MIERIRHHAARAAAPLALLPALAAAICGAPARAADPAFNAAIVSDYRLRGVSLSNRRPAVQGGLDVGLAGGWSVGAWASSIARYGGTRIEADLHAGRSGTVAGFDYTATAYAYLYPGGRGVRYGELQAIAGRTIGNATFSVEAAYSPRQRNIDRANLYLGAQAELAIPATALSVRLRGGREQGFYHHKLDWEAGIDRAGKRVNLSAGVVGTNRRRAMGRLAGMGAVVSAGVGF